MTVGQYYSTYQGQRVNSCGGILGECVANVQLANNLIYGIGDCPLFPVPVASMIPGSRDDAFTWVANSPTGVPPYGSTVVFGAPMGGQVRLSNGQVVYAGHTGIAIEGSDTNKVRIIQQNDPVGTGVSIKEYNYNSVLGWYVPKSQSPQPPQGASDMITNADTDIVRIVNSEVKGWDFNAVHTGQYDAREMAAWVGKDVKQLLREGWIEGTAWHNTRNQQMKDYPTLVKQVYDLNKVNATLVAENNKLKQQLADCAAGGGTTPPSGGIDAETKALIVETNTVVKQTQAKIDGVFK